MKADITLFAMEIDFQTFIHLLAMEEVGEKCPSIKYSICNSFQVISNLIMDGN